MKCQNHELPRKHNLCWGCFVLLICSFNVLTSQSIYINNSGLYRCDLKSCTVDFLCKIDREAYDIALAPDKNIYGITGGGTLYKLDTLNGKTTLIFQLPSPGAWESYNSLVADLQGVFYITGSHGRLFSFDLNSKTLKEHGNIGYPASGDLTFFNGKLYMMAIGNRVIAVNLDDPSKSSIFYEFSINPNQSVTGIFSYSESCSGKVRAFGTIGSAPNLYEFDLINKTAQFVCTLSGIEGNIGFGGGTSTYEFLLSSPINIVEKSIKNPSCDQKNGLIEINASGGSGNFTYALNGEDFQTSGIFNNLDTGTYFIKVRDEKTGCIDMISKELTQPPKIKLNISHVDSRCGKKNGSISISANLSNQLRFVWSNGETTQNLSNLNSGKYKVTVTDQSNCSLEDSIQINAIETPYVSVSSSPSICGKPSGVVIITNPELNKNLTYSIDGINFTSTNEFRNLLAGKFIVHARNQACDTSVQIFVRDSTSLQEQMTIKTTATSCNKNNGEIIILGGSRADISYSLDNSSFKSDTVFRNLSPGKHQLSIKNTDGCTVSKEITLDQGSVVKVETEISPSICKGETGTIKIRNIAGGKPPYLVGFGDSLSFETQTFFSGLKNTKYILFIKDQSECPFTKKEVILENETCTCKDEIFSPDIFTPNNDGVNDVFVIHGSKNISGFENLSIYNRWGKLVYTSATLKSSSDENWWDGTLENNGVFLWTIVLVYKNGKKERCEGHVTLAR